LRGEKRDSSPEAGSGSRAEGEKVTGDLKSGQFVSNATGEGSKKKRGTVKAKAGGKKKE